MVFDLLSVNGCSSGLAVNGSVLAGGIRTHLELIVAMMPRM